MDENSLTKFAFQNQEIRFVGEFPVANDVAAALGYSDPSKTISTKVKEKNKGVTKLVTPGGTQSVTVLKEAGIYELIFASKLESAEKFQDWVFEAVLPSIRKTGQYQTKPLSPAEMIIAQGQAMLELEKKQAELATKVDILEDFVHQHDSEIDRIFNPNGHYFSVMGYACKIGKKVSIKQSADIGRKCSNYCRKNGIQFDKLTDPRFGLVGVYPESVIKMFLD